MPDILSRLLRAPHTFNLFQAVSLLERAAPERAPVGTGAGMDEAVRLAAHVDLAFAPSDIASLQPNAYSPAWTLRTPAVTLAGAQGPLAMPFTELLLEQRSARNPAGLDFLDIFNGRLIALRHRARAKQHLALHPGDLGTAPLPRAIDALSGLGRGQGAYGPAGEQGWLRHASLQHAAPRSMTSLLALLRDRFDLHFTGEQFVGGWHRLAARDRARLGGKGASLGARAWDQAAGMALALPPLGAEKFAGLLPGSPRFALLGWLVAHHLQADFTVTLTLTLADAPASRLQAGVRLGRNVWLSSRAGAAATYRPARFVLSAPQSHLASAA
ncbi:MAG: type VI secretion system baseplate subunit TssG [Duganella sp.]